MPLRQNQDGTWQWGEHGKKYKKKQDAIKQMKAIFANGYVEKHASYTDVLGMIKRADYDRPSANFIANSKLKAQDLLPNLGFRFSTYTNPLNWHFPYPFQDTTYVNTKNPLQVEKLIYGGTSNKDQDREVNKAVQDRFLHTQRMRAMLAGKQYDPKKIYAVPYSDIFGGFLTRNLFQAGPYRYQLGAKETRNYADNPTLLGSIPGYLGVQDPIQKVLHQLGHSATRGTRKGTDGAPKLFERAASGTEGIQAGQYVKGLLSAKRYNMGPKQSLSWLYQTKNAKIRAGLLGRLLGRVSQPYLVHPASGYYNSAPEAATGLHQLFGIAASHGKFLKNWNQLLPWLVQKGYVTVNKNAGGELALGKSIPGMTTLRHTGLQNFLRMQNYLKGLQQKPNRTAQEAAQLEEARKRLNLLSQVADTRSAVPQRRISAQYSPNYIAYNEGQTKAAALNGAVYNDINNKGSLYMTYTDVYNMIKQAAGALPEESAMHPGQAGKTPKFTGAGGAAHPMKYLKEPIGKFKGVAKGKPEYKKPGSNQFTPTTKADINTVKNNYKRVGKAVGIGDYLLFPTKE